MGMVSYFEDIRSRFDESSYGPEGVIQGPPGGSTALTVATRLQTRSKCYVTTAGAVTADRRDLYDLLRDDCRVIGHQVQQGMKHCDWRAIAHDADQLDRDVQGFSRDTLFNTIAMLKTHSGALEERWHAVSKAVDAILARMRPLVIRIEKTLREIQRGRRADQHVEKNDREAEETAKSLLRGWGELEAQASRLRERLQKLRVQLGDELFVRIVEHPSFRPEAKD
jgi:hypothetical protein